MGESYDTGCIVLVSCQDPELTNARSRAPARVLDLYLLKLAKSDLWSPAKKNLTLFV